MKVSAVGRASVYIIVAALAALCFSGCEGVVTKQEAPGGKQPVVSGGLPLNI